MSHKIANARFYVYTLTRTDDTVFYVGKGTGRRMYDHDQEARRNCQCHKCRTIRKIWASDGRVGHVIVFRTNDELQAYQYEQRLIEQIGLANLTNDQPGGIPALPMRRGPDKPKHEWTEQEHLNWLRNQYGVTPKQVRTGLMNWRKCRLTMLEAEIKAAKVNLRLHGRGSVEEIDQLEQEAQQVRIALGRVFQGTLF